MSKNKLREIDYTPFIKNDREIANVATHGFGLLLALIGMPFLIYWAYKTGNSALFGGVAVFAVSMLLVYVSSTLYHYYQRPGLKRRLRMFDHICIYYLIAGTYTPFMLIYLDDASGSMVLWLVWAAAAAGTVFKLFTLGKYNFLSTFFYLAMGWVAVIFVHEVLENFPPVCLNWILGGAAFYSIGVIFYLWKRYKYHHAIWHLFVMGGSICHYIAVYYSVSTPV